MNPAPAGRAVVAVLALVAGGLLGSGVLFLHGYWWGLVLGIGATVAWLVTIPGGWWSRLPLAVGWDAAVLLLSLERPEGDYLVASDASGYVLLGSGVVVLLGGIVGLRRHPAPEPAINAGDAPTS